MVVLLFVATTVNYMDRQVLSLTWKDFIAPEFHWTDNDYGTITAMFSIVYAVCMLFAGKFVPAGGHGGAGQDRYGHRRTACGYGVGDGPRCFSPGAFD